jgi:hypothetical protein
MEPFDIKELIAYMEATPEESWCVDLCRTDDRAQHCVLSHVLNFAGVDGLDFFEERWATMSMMFPVNDGQHEKYQQPTPKARCLAYLADLRDSKERSTADHLERAATEGQFWRSGTTYAYFRVRQ